MKTFFIFLKGLLFKQINTTFFFLGVSHIPTLDNITTNLSLKDPIVALINKDFLSKTFPSCYNENTLPSVGECSMQLMIKDKDDCASISVSSTKTNERIAEYRQQKRQQFNFFKKTARSEVSDENSIMNELPTY